MSNELEKLKEDFDYVMKRAMQYIYIGDAQGAFSSFASDIKKFPEIEKRVPKEVLFIGLLEVPNGPQAVKKWLEGFPKP